MRLLKGFLWVLLLAAVCTPGSAGVILQPYEAPEWNVSEWINGDPGPLRNQRGRVLVIEFFQLWCPGCNEFSIPLMNEWTEKWKDRDDVMVVSIHTVFEGHDVQTPQRLREFVREKQIRHPVGIDKYSSSDPETPITMNRFNTGGTPHVVIVDKEGDLRFSHFGRFDPATIEAFVDRLTKERGSGVRPGPRTAPPRQAAGRPNPRTGGRPAAPGPTTRPVAFDKPDAQNDPRKRDGAGEEKADLSDPTDEIEEGDPDKDENLARLAGSYQMQFQQKSKSCGTRARPENLPVEISVADDRIVARFKGRFLGLNQFAADYDAASGRFSAETMRRSDEDGVGITLRMKLHGTVDLNADPPTLQFQFELEKEGDEPGWECKIAGHGSATRSKR